MGIFRQVLEGNGKFINTLDKVLISKLTLQTFITRNGRENWEIEYHIRHLFMLINFLVQGTVSQEAFLKSSCVSKQTRFTRTYIEHCIMNS